MIKKLFLLFLLFSFQQIFAQTPEELLEKTRLNYTPEKIYIHYDKQSYIAGDTIWFKAYLLNGFLPSTQSTVLNVELLSDSGKIIGKKIIPISASMAANGIELPSNLKQGSYTVTAFTSLMMNFGTTNFYNKQINIYNPENIQIEKNVAYLPEIKFMPEAGNLVAGFQNTIAFKCTDNNGFPLSVVGKVINSEGKVLAEFKSIHDGMGKFEMQPTLGEKYFAECIIDGITKKTVALPESVYNVSLMKVNNKNGKSLLEINSSNITNETKMPAYILGVEENMIAFKIPLNEAERIIKAELPTATLPSGILKITMFNKENQPLAERLIFVNSGDYEVKTNLITNSVNTTARKKIELIFEIDDTTAGSYSVAVTNAEIGIDNVDGKDNIISRFLLTDNLKGKINNPAYYFEKNDEVHAQHIDLLMLTNGWRRYSWTEIMTNKFPEMVFKDPNYISLSGIAYAPFTKNPLVEKTLLFYAKTKDSVPDFFNVTTDKQGGFELRGVLFEDTAKFFIQNNNAKDKRINLKLTSPCLSSLFSIHKNNIPYFNFTKPTQSQTEQIAKMLDAKQLNQKNITLLEAIKVTAKVKSKLEVYEKKYITGIMGGSPNQTLDLLTTPPPIGINIFDFMKTKLSGVSILGGPIDYTLNYRNIRSLTGGPIPMQIYVDDFQVESNLISNMPAENFAVIKVYGNGPMAGSGGALALYSNKDKKINFGYSSFSEEIIEGFSVTKEFYSPNYDMTVASNGLSDNRTTLYWNPYLTADKDSKKIKVGFFNSDNAKKFKVVLEGVTRDGGLVHLEKVVE